MEEERIFIMSVKVWEIITHKCLLIVYVCGRACWAAVVICTVCSYVCYVCQCVQFVLSTQYILLQPEPKWVIISKTEIAHSVPHKLAQCVCVVHVCEYIHVIIIHILTWSKCTHKTPTCTHTDPAAMKTPVCPLVHMNTGMFVHLHLWGHSQV